MRPRHSSFDSSPYFNSTYTRSKAPRNDSDEDNYDPLAFRSQSTTSEKRMNRLRFDRVQEDIQHPLSSKRSCSEFNDFSLSSTKNDSKEKKIKSKSLWNKIFSSNSKRSQSTGSIDPRPFESFSSTISSAGNLTPMENVIEPSPRKHYQRNRYKSSISEEVGIALDIVFGYGPPMEIELKNLGNTGLSSAHSSRENLDDLPFPRVNSNNSIRSNRSVRSNQSYANRSRSNSGRSNSATDLSENDDETSSSASLSSLGYNYPDQFRYLSYTCWRDFLCYKFEEITLGFRRYCYPDDNNLFYNLQIQPFSSGIYLRGMLASGSNSLIFHTYTLIFLPAEIKPFWATSDSGWFDFERILVTLLVLQVVLNVLVAPVRIILHYECWQTTRSYDTDHASHALQDLIQTNVWLLNRILAWSLDVLAILVLIIGEIYLIACTSSSPGSSLLNFFSTHSDDVSAVNLGYAEYGKDPLSALIVDMCATNILSFLLRALVCLLYYLSIADPEVLNGKRRRKGGLSNFDLDLMPTFVFTDKEEVVNNECSICLTNFEMGEMLISLPCHQRHSFHANCIREWLQHDAKCPLCQKGI